METSKIAIRSVNHHVRLLNFTGEESLQFGKELEMLQATEDYCPHPDFTIL